MIQRPVLRLAAAFALAPVILAASPFDGTYKQTANGECGLIGVDGGALRIEGDIFYGVEVECRMTNPVEIEGMTAKLYDMACIGDGSTWEERAILMADAEEPGLYMIWDGYAFRYERCDIPTATEVDAD